MKSFSRQLKSDLEAQMAGPNAHAAIAAAASHPARRVINALISFYCHANALVRWRAIEATGRVVAAHAENDPESARVIMRRLLWMLNDESGGIGWGVPEAMGEVLAESDRLCSEYHRIYLSYVQPACNFLEHPILQRGLLWGIGRLARRRGSLVRPFLPDIEPFLISEDPYHRAFAATVAAFAGEPSGMLARMAHLSSDTAVIEIYEDSVLQKKTVAEIYRTAMAVRAG